MVQFACLVLLAASARAEAPPEPTPVTFEQVLDHPDDIELNLQFARQQIQDGDLRGAEASLERVLAADPNREDAGLLHATVLLRLGNAEESEAELDALGAAATSVEMRERIADFKRRVSRSQRRGTVGAVVGFGYNYATNADAAPSSGQALLADTPLVLTPDTAKRDDAAAMMLAGLDASHVLGNGHQLFGALTYYREEQTLLKRLNIQAYSALAGVAFNTSLVQIKPTLIFDQLMLAQRMYLRDRGASLRLEHYFPEGLSLFAEARDVYHDYSPTPSVPLARQRDGIQVNGILGLDYLLTPRLKAGLSLDHAIKHASFDPYAFDRDGFDASLAWLLGKGMFLSSDLVVLWDRYPTPDTAISARNRQDNTWRWITTLGVPLGRLSPALDDFVLTLTYQYFQAVSTILNYTYTNNKGAMMLTYRWELGL